MSENRDVTFFPIQVQEAFNIILSGVFGLQVKDFLIYGLEKRGVYSGIEDIRVVESKVG